MSQEPQTPKAGRLELALGEIPVFPLPQVVLFPRARLPLHVFEPRYRAMLKDAIETNGFLVIARIGIGEGTIGDPPICRIAGVGAIVEHETLPGGRSNIVLAGMQRVEIEELPFVPPYRRVRARILTDTRTLVAPNDRTSLVAAATAFVTEVHRRDPSFSFHLPPSLESGAIADLCAHHLIIDADTRQAILEELDPAGRVRIVTRELALQQQLLGRERGGALN
jgi:ATP-dependent Lon protease